VIHPWKQILTPSMKIRPCSAKDLRRPAALRASAWAWFLAATLIPAPLSAADVKQSTAANVVEAMRPVEAPVNHAGTLYQSGNRRDPFLNPIPLKKKSKDPVDEEADRGTAPPGISGTYIAQAALKGISIQETDRVAVVRGADNRDYFLREGDRLFDGYLKAIDIDSITLVRETKMKSGKVLTQDVTVRLRTP
jgi:hypothetical protein